MPWTRRRQPPRHGRRRGARPRERRRLDRHRQPPHGSWSSPFVPVPASGYRTVCRHFQTRSGDVTQHTRRAGGLRHSAEATAWLCSYGVPVTSLGMPALPPPTTDPPWRTAWDRALYGPSGFYRRCSPREHFRTAVHGSDLLAGALVRLARDGGLGTVVDMGAGGGELLRDLHRLAPDLTLAGVDVAARPEDLPPAVAWAPDFPVALDGLVVAHEWLDNIPCHVVEVDRSGVPRLVHVDPATGRESWGHALDAPGVPASIRSWLARWWPLD